MKKYNDICKKVEETSGLKPRTPKQFDELAERIYYQTGRVISPTTLKRIWGYIDEPLSTRRSTLDILAGYCGWKDYDDFEKGNIPESESGKVGSKSIIVESEMKRGERIRLMWSPSRVCVIEYQGNRDWKIMKVEGSRLSVGDTFKCSIIAEGEPLYLDNLTHDSIPVGIYVCGRKSGVTFIRE